MISPIIIPLNKCNFKSCFTCTMEKNMQFKQSRLPESFQKYITKEKGYLLCILKIIFYHLIFLAVYQNRLAKSIFFLKKIMLSSNGHFFLFRKFLVYISERKNMLFKNMLLKKKTCFIMHKLILYYNGVVSFELTSDLLSSVLCFKWSVFWKKSIPFSKKTH